MAQNPLVIPSTGILSGLQLVTDVNAAIAAIATQNAGPTAPVDPVQYQIWYNTTTDQVLMYNGTSWVPVTNGAALSGVDVVTTDITVGTGQIGLLLECQGTAALTITLPNPADYLGANTSVFNDLSGTAAVTVSGSAGSFIGVGTSGSSSVTIPVGYVATFISDGYNWITISSIGFALVGGSSSNQFNVANATGAQNAVPLLQAQQTFAALNGSTIQVFNVGNAVTNTEAPNLGQANGLYGQLAQSNTWAKQQVLNGGASVPAQSGSLVAGTAPTGSPAAFSQLAFGSGFSSLIEDYYNGSTNIYRLDANGNLTISGSATLAGALSATGTASAAPATASGNLLQLGQVQNGTLSPTFVDGTFSGSVVVSGTVSGAPAVTSGELLQLGQVQDASLSISVLDATVDGPIAQIAGTGTDNETPFLQAADLFTPWVVNGLLTPVPSPASLTGDLSPGVAYVSGQRIVGPSSVTDTFSGSSDTYVDLNYNGLLTYTAVANGAASPSLAPNSLRLEKVVTSPILSPTPTLTAGTSGTLASGTYQGALVAFDATGYGVASTAVSIAVTASGSIDFAWANPQNETSMGIYVTADGSTTLGLVASGVTGTTYTYTGAVAPGTAPPTVATSNAIQSVDQLAPLYPSLAVSSLAVTKLTLSGLVVSSTTTAGNITATAAQLAGQYLADGATQTAAFTVTTDTAVNILAAMPNAAVGTAFKWRFINNDQSSTGYAGTLAGGAGVTVGTTLPNPAVGQGNWEDYIFTFTAVGATPTITVEAVGGSSLGLL